MDENLIPLPSVSLISSWYVPLPSHSGDRDIRRSRSPRPAVGLPALEIALTNRIALHDLYFLGDSDLPWYAEQCGFKLRAESTPLDFAASLDVHQLTAIADALNRLLSGIHYRGTLVGYRPRFTALATYWPFISLPRDEDKDHDDVPTQLWEKSIRAVRNSLYLASALGCRHVEMVGGSAVPEHFGARREIHVPSEYRNLRMDRLVEGLREIFNSEFDELFDPVFNPEPSSKKKVRQPEQRLPYLCMEIEPGESYLISKLDEFERLHVKLLHAPETNRASKWGKPARHLLLNADIAHIFLSGGSNGMDHHQQLADKFEKFKKIAAAGLLGHFHLSDHARSHAADLSPGVYHFFEDYERWLRVAIETMMRHGRKFSGTVAIELEACNDIHEAARAVSKVSRWLEDIQRLIAKELTHEGKTPTADPQVVEGALLVVDIGKSTETFFAHHTSATENSRQLSDLVSEVCQAVQQHRGSVLSFTGDGVIALFDHTHYFTESEAATQALDAARTIGQKVFRFLKTGTGPSESGGITLRAGLHFGRVFVPSFGHLRQQAIGRDVVVTSRLCDWISKTIEPAVPANARQMILAVSDDFADWLPATVLRDFREWGEAHFKGLNDPIKVWIEKAYYFNFTPVIAPAVASKNGR